MPTKTITPIDHTTIAKIERDLADKLNALTSCAPDPNAPEMTEANWDTVGLAVAKMMKTCASYLVDAGFETEDAYDLADEVERTYSQRAKTRIQICPGCGVMPGEGMDEDCTGDLECGEPNQ